MVVHWESTRIPRLQKYKSIAIFLFSGIWHSLLPTFQAALREVQCTGFARVPLVQAPAHGRPSEEMNLKKNLATQQHHSKVKNSLWTGESTVGQAILWCGD